MNFVRSVSKWIQKHRIIALLVAVVFTCSIIAFRVIQSRSSGTLTEPIARGQIIQSVYGIGTVMSNKNFQIKLGVVSTIHELFVKEGDSVKKKDKLAKIDEITYRAPFDGTVTSLPFNVGENAFTNVPILSLVDLSDRYLVVSLEQQGALRVQKGQKVKMSFDTIREQNYDGEVESVYSNESNFLARIDISQLPARILPWMTADVAIFIRTQDNVLLIPIAAMEKGGVVWRKRGHVIPKKIEVKLGIVDKAMGEVVSGDLEVGDQLLIRKVITP